MLLNLQDVWNQWSGRCPPFDVREALKGACINASQWIRNQEHHLKSSWSWLPFLLFPTQVGPISTRILLFSLTIIFNFAFSAFPGLGLRFFESYTRTKARINGRRWDGSKALWNQRKSPFLLSWVVLARLSTVDRHCRRQKIIFLLAFGFYSYSSLYICLYDSSIVTSSHSTFYMPPLVWNCPTATKKIINRLRSTQSWACARRTCFGTWKSDK